MISDTVKDVFTKLCDRHGNYLCCPLPRPDMGDHNARYSSVGCGDCHRRFGADLPAAHEILTSQDKSEKRRILANIAVTENRAELIEQLSKRWDTKTRVFIDYWFALETQIELMALVVEIEKIADETIKAFFELIFSAIIITKSGGVSLAFDLAHTRPHKAKVVISQSGEILFGKELKNDTSPRIKFLTKTLRSPLAEFEKRFKDLEQEMENEINSLIKERSK